MTDSYRILAVCTGNICRSPAMERLLSRLFGQEPEIDVISGGTYAHDGEDMQKPMKKRVANYGAEVENFVAQQVTPSMIESSDLILAATRVHVRDMLAEVPSAAGRMFTIRELGRLLTDMDGAQLSGSVGQSGRMSEKLTVLIPLLERARATTGSAGKHDDVVDPYMLPADVYDESFRQIREPVETLGEVLGVPR